MLSGWSSTIRMLVLACLKVFSESALTLLTSLPQRFRPLLDQAICALLLCTMLTQTLYLLPDRSLLSFWFSTPVKMVSQPCDEYPQAAAETELAQYDSSLV